MKQKHKRRRVSSTSGGIVLRLDRLSFQQSLVEQFVELLFVLLGIDDPFSQVPQPKPSPRVRERWIYHLKSQKEKSELRTVLCITLSMPYW